MTVIDVLLKTVLFAILPIIGQNMDKGLVKHLILREEKSRFVQCAIPGHHL
jgi:hypothetical protein